jgi:hypothetical protein
MIRTHSVFERLARLALAVMVCVAAAVASAAPGDPDLRFLPSASEQTVGYIVYVGDESGFFGERASVAQLDISSNYTLVNGVAHYPLGDLIAQSAWVVMTAYDSEGFESAGSNEIFAEIAVACAVDADCDDDNVCNGSEICSGGTCSSTTPPVCTSAGPCSVASCDPLTGCSVENLPNGSQCNDGDPSTVNDSCQAGSCRGDGVPEPEPECATDNDCGDANACNGAERCVSGSCVTGTPLVCAGPDQCTFASCNPAFGCVVEPASDGLWCDDGDAATSADVCSAGFCAGEVSPDDSSEPFYFEDFEAFSDGADPIGWLDTAGGSFDELADDFYVAELSDGNHVMQTESWDRDIHSHLLDGESAEWSGYELSGRMQIDRANAGIGVTLYSDFPNTDTYYRLRHYGPYSFQLAGHPDGEDQCVGDTDTNVVPAANRWYVFRFRAFPEGGGTRVQAKVWDSETPEPASWQADCFDPAATALTGGAPGLSSRGIGVKSWDDLEVYPVSSAVEAAPETASATDSSTATRDS